MGDCAAGPVGEPAAGRLRRCVLAALVLGLVVACSDPDQPSTLPSDTPKPTSSSSSASPSPETVEQEVEAAVRAYYAELTRAAQTNDTTLLKTMSTKGCPCYRPVRVIERGMARGEITPNAEWTITSLKVHDIEDGLALAEVRYNVSAYDVVDESGELVAQVKAQSSHYDLSMVRTDRRWIVGNVFDLES